MEVIVMKLLTTSCVISLTISLLAWGQVPGNDREHVIKHIIVTGLISGTKEKVIDGTGDASADVIMKLFTGTPVKKESIPGILLVLNHAFVGDPTANQDLQPRHALFVLKSIEPVTSDPAVITQISQTRIHLLRYKKVSQP
jgi:hypothetical protein